MYDSAAKRSAVIYFNASLRCQSSHIPRYTRRGFLLLMQVLPCHGWCACGTGAPFRMGQKRLFYFYFFPSPVPLQRWNHLLAPLQWQLVGMHIVIKQFPVCKCPVYTLLLQSLSLDRLLEYEKHSHRMKNENSGTSIKKIHCAHSRLKKWLKLMSKRILTQTHTHTRYRGGEKKKRGYSSQRLCYSLLMEEAVGKLLA